MPTEPLGDSAGNRTHRQSLMGAARSLPELVGGGTALYDTTLAAFRTAQAGYDPRRANSVVIFTDGRNEDPDGLSLDRLLETLESEVDPATPIQLLTIGMGPDVDANALARISAATGGRSYTADDPRDVPRIFGDAMLERVGWGLR